jgi:hypothetical protein
MQFEKLLKLKCKESSMSDVRDMKTFLSLLLLTKPPDNPPFHFLTGRGCLTGGRRGIYSSTTFLSLRAKGSGHPGEMLTRGVLNSILPPREFKNETGEDLIPFVSTAPAARSDVLKLQHLLDSTLQQRKAREGGVCPIRSEIYGQCFDEIIRQVTIRSRSTAARAGFCSSACATK